MWSRVVPPVVSFSSGSGANECTLSTATGKLLRHPANEQNGKREMEGGDLLIRPVGPIALLIVTDDHFLCCHEVGIKQERRVTVPLGKIHGKLYNVWMPIVHGGTGANFIPDSLKSLKQNSRVIF